MLAVAAAAAVAYLYGWDPSEAYWSVQPSCTVGVAGTEATTTVQGWTSRSLCDAWVGTNSQYRTEPTGVLICRYPKEGLRLTVRDTGALKLVGSELCRQIGAQTLQQLRDPCLYVGPDGNLVNLCKGHD